MTTSTGTGHPYNPDKILGTNPHNNSMRYTCTTNYYYDSDVTTQIIYNKGINLYKQQVL